MNPILHFLISIISEKDKKGKLIGSSKRVSGLYFTGLFTYVTYFVINAKEKLPNSDLIADILEYTFYFILIMAFGIGAIGIIGKVRNKNLVTGNTDAEIGINQEENQAP